MPGMMLPSCFLALSGIAFGDCSAETGSCGRSLLQTARGGLAPERNCEELVHDDCDFDTEKPSVKFDCVIEHASRLMYAAWVRPQAAVLEIGARYGQTSCLLSQVLQPAGTGATVFSVDADPTIWATLESNLARHSCEVVVVKGTIGSKTMKLVEHGYGSRVVPKENPHPGIDIPAHSVESLNTTFDTLAIDCEGCFRTFLEENPSLLNSLTMIMAEIHDPYENEVVEKLLKQGWEMKHQLRRQRILCKGPCEMQCSNKQWVNEHAEKYDWGTRRQGGKAVHFGAPPNSV